MLETDCFHYVQKWVSFDGKAGCLRSVFSLIFKLVASVKSKAVFLLILKVIWFLSGENCVSLNIRAILI